MKTLVCDNCKSSEKDIKTYTYCNIFMNIKYDYYLTIAENMAYKPLPQKEFCDNCATVIQKAYQQFLKEFIS